MFSLSLLTPFVGLVKRAASNQIEEFTDYQVFVQRVLSVSASSASIVFCVVGIYLLIAIDPRRFIFRHQLIFFLLMFDFLKALILLLYPARVLSHALSYNNERFCQVVGFFTAVAIEGADLAILSFAIHTYLLIFKPNFQTRVKNSQRTEGGLYRFRYYVYALSFLIPVVMASLGFILREGYELFVCWCYLPQRPVWYRFVLSWVPRYCIGVTIIIIYGSIYFHVIKEFKSLGGMFTTFHRSHALHPTTSQDEKPTFFSAFKFFISRMFDHINPKFVLPDSDEIKRHQKEQKAKDEELKVKNLKLQRDKKKRKESQQHQKEDTSVDTDNDNDNDTKIEDGEVGPTQITPQFDPEQILYDPEIQQQNLEDFRKRQKIIEKQMKSIFIYPFAYCFIWIFPFILQSTQVNYEESHGPIIWLNIVGAFMQPIPGFVDTCVLFYREQPWKYTAMAIFEKEQSQRMDSLIGSGSHAGRGADTDSVATSARMAKTSISTGLIDIESYKPWRQWLSYLRFPLFRLPDEYTAHKLQEKYASEKMNSENGDSNNINAGVHVIRPTNANKNPGTHDFSDVLAGDFKEQEFRDQLNNFSLNFDKKSKRNTNQRNRQPSIMSSLRSNPVSSVKDPLSIRSASISRMSMSHPRNSISRGSLHPKDSIKRANSDQQIYVKETDHPARRSTAARSMDNDLDFLQFLKDGPPK